MTANRTSTEYEYNLTISGSLISIYENLSHTRVHGNVYGRVRVRVCVLSPPHLCWVLARCQMAIGSHSARNKRPAMTVRVRVCERASKRKERDNDRERDKGVDRG